ncbi:MAG: hypothetical protein FWE47_01320, partial [Oscillospiraceae bacterium]|nr:hypothetical protein [Oscillospiraceae bacterium]
MEKLNLAKERGRVEEKVLKAGKEVLARGFFDDNLKDYITRARADFVRIFMRTNEKCANESFNSRSADTFVGAIAHMKFDGFEQEINAYFSKPENVKVAESKSDIILNKY